MPHTWPSLPLRQDRRLEALEVRRLHALDAAVEAEGGRLVGTDEIDRQVRLDLVLQARGPEDAVDQEAAVTGIENVFRRALGAVESPALLAAAPRILAGPGARHRRLLGIGLRLRIHRNQRLAGGEHREILRRATDVAAGVAEGGLRHAL